jgi:hypothetical protein
MLAGPKSYHVTHKVLSMPSATTLVSFMRKRKLAAIIALSKGDESGVSLQVQESRS